MQSSLSFIPFADLTADHKADIIKAYDTLFTICDSTSYRLRDDLTEALNDEVTDFCSVSSVSAVIAKRQIVIAAYRGMALVGGIEPYKLYVMRNGYRLAFMIGNDLASRDIEDGLPKFISLVKGLAVED